MFEEFNSYPTNGESFAPLFISRSQLEKKEAERAEVLAEVPLLKKVLQRLEKRISFYESVNSIPDDVKTKPEEFMHTVAANKLTRLNLIAEKRYIEARIKNAR